MAKKKEEVKKIKCTCCGLTKDEKEFAPSWSFQNRQTKRLSMCKVCCSELYDRKLMTYQDERIALYRFCMELDIPYEKKLVETTFDKRSSNTDKNIGHLYLAKMGLAQYRNKTFETDMPFVNIFGLNKEELESLMYLNIEETKEQIAKEAKKIITPEVIARWGDGLESEDYIFLEERYNVCCETYEDTNPANLWTYEEICMNYLSLRKNRGNPTAVKQIQETISKLQADCKMKQSQIDNSEDEEACMGKFIDKIELYEPCDRALPFFEDIDRIGKYIKRFFVQPFAKEHGIPVSTLDDMEGIDDYQDINKIYQEIESNSYGEENE